MYTCTLHPVRERTSGRSLARLAVRCHDICGDDTIRHKSLQLSLQYHGGGLPWSSATMPEKRRIDFVFSSHIIIVCHHGDTSYYCARGAELLLPNTPSSQCHHLTLLTANRPTTKHVCCNYLYCRPLADHDSWSLKT